MAGLVVFSDTAAISSAQEVAAQLGSCRDIGDVRVQGGGEVGGEGFTRKLERRNRERNK